MVMQFVSGAVSGIGCCWSSLNLEFPIQNASVHFARPSMGMLYRWDLPFDHLPFSGAENGLCPEGKCRADEEKDSCLSHHALAFEMHFETEFGVSHIHPGLALQGMVDCW